MHDYDTYWKQWIDCEIYGPTLRHQRKNILRLLDNLNFNSVLDIGSGSGDNLREILKNRKMQQLCLLDISKQALERARNIITNAEFVQLDIEKNSLNRKFDLILCCDVLEHISDDISALKNIRKMANKYLVISTLLGKMRNSERYVGHVRNYTLEGLRGKLLVSGFKPIKTLRWGFPFYSPLYRNFWDKLPAEINYGKFGIFRKVCANILYFVFMLNSKSKGDYLFMLLETI